LAELRKVSRDTALKFQKDHDLLYFIESSALDGSNIEKLFVDMSKFLYSRFHEQIDEEMRANSAIAG
jgi:hypothetical protein